MEGEQRDASFSHENRTKESLGASAPLAGRGNLNQLTSSVVAMARASAR